MKLVHDQFLCEQHGLCVTTDPDRFDFDDDDELVIRSFDVTPEELATVRRAVASCPRQALRLTDAGSGRVAVRG